jgi:succinate dehydrogenase/fumarate reductase flavoprotein subunit
LRDPSGRPVGPFVDRPNNRYGDPVVDVYQDIFIDFKKSGRGPVYMDCDGLTDEELEYMLFWLHNEANTPLIHHLQEEGIDIRKHPIEFTTYECELFPRGGIYYDEGAGTSIPGLYAAGDEFFGGISGAAVFGWIAGESAAAYAKDHGMMDPVHLEPQLEASRGLFSGLREREDGPDWKEANTLLQQIMWDYAGLVRSETLLEAGLHALRRLKDKACTTLIARNSHELMRALEVLNMIEIGELIFVAAQDRKETRGKHIRVDYPFANPLLEKLLIVKRQDGKATTEWRKLKRA